MNLVHTAFVGIDPTAGRSPFTYAVLDENRNILALAEGEQDGILDFLGDFSSVIIAINAPSHANAGLVRKKEAKQEQTPGSLRGVDLRVAEHELRLRGISVSATPYREDNCPGWVQLGFSMYRSLAKMGYRAFPNEEKDHLWLETHPHACFAVLIDQIPLPKPTLEGRLQRQVILHDLGLGIRDPMNFFEEITRLRLRQGVLPMDLIYYPEQLDALVAAYTAWFAKKEPGGITRVGEKEEGYINLPVGKLKEKY
jgi:hypothetical protein